VLQSDDRHRLLRMMQRKLVGVLFTIFGLIFWASAAVATPAGTVVGVSGSCTDQGHALIRNDAVQIGDTLEVPADGKLKLRMADGSVISIASGSRMTVANYESAGAGREVKLLLTQGALRAQVTSVRGPSKFEVSIPVGTASVHSGSADWFVKVEAGSAQVGVLAGTVDLTSSLTGASVSIPARWGTRLEAGLDPVLPRVWRQREFNAVTRLTGA
jgi:hypothetical protein